MFLVNNRTIAFLPWIERGVTSLGQLLNGGLFMTFNHIKKEYNIPDYCYFQFIQLKEAIKKSINIKDFNNQSPPLFTKITSLKPQKILSQIYKLLAFNNTTTAIPTDKWTTDINDLPTDTNWLNICNNTFSMTCNSKIQLIQYKVLHRTHITTHKLHCMGFSQNNTCSLCPNSVDNYIHALWHCPPIHNFWSEVTNRLSEMLSLSIPTSPTIALLGDLSSLHISKQHISFLLTSLTIAKKTILLNWKDRTKISVTHWLNLLTDHSNLEKLTATLKNNITVYDNTWSPFLQYIQC